MLDDFFVRAVLAGIGVALVAGPLGCFIIWRKMAYFGDTLAHAALLGVAVAFLIDIEPIFAVFFMSIAISLALFGLQKRASLSTDALLGLLAHSTLAVGLVILAFMTWIRFDLMSFLFGDILAVSKTDIVIIYASGVVVLAVLALIWRSLFATTISHDLAQAEGINPDRVNLVFMILMAIIIAIAMKIVGVLLITAMLLIPGAAARRFSSSPEVMALLSAIIGILSVVSGLFASKTWDTPSGPSIVVAAFLLFVLCISPLGLGIRWLQTHYSRPFER